MAAAQLSGDLLCDFEALTRHETDAAARLAHPQDALEHTGVWGLGKRTHADRRTRKQLVSGGRGECARDFIFLKD